MTEVAVDQRASSEGIRSPEMSMVKVAVVEAVVAALARGETVLAVARAYDLDPKTVRSWRQRGQYRARRPASGRRGGLLAPFLTWLAVRAPEVGFNAVVLHREFREQGFTGSEIIVRRAVRPWRLAATPVATVRFESAPGEQAQVDFGQQRVWIANGLVAAQLFVCTLGYPRRLFAVAFPQQRLREGSLDTSWPSSTSAASQAGSSLTMRRRWCSPTRVMRSCGIRPAPTSLRTTACGRGRVRRIGRRRRARWNRA